jgi:DNA-binding GntR family transcriptional regulator
MSMLNPSTKQHPSLVDRLVEQVFAAVVEGRLAPGSKITEEQIATDFGVSRTPVREAVRRLAEMGVLVVRPRCGLEVVSFDLQDLQQITVLRAELEGFALRLAMARITDAEIQALQQAHNACEAQLRSGDRVAVFRADSRFHLLLAEFSGNLHLADTLQKLDVKVQLCRMFFCASMEKITASVQAHRPLLAAMQARRTATAVELLRAHILQSAFPPAVQTKSRRKKI